MKKSIFGKIFLFLMALAVAGIFGCDNNAEGGNSGGNGGGDGDPNSGYTPTDDPETAATRQLMKGMLADMEGAWTIDAQYEDLANNYWGHEWPKSMTIERNGTITYYYKNGTQRNLAAKLASDLEAAIPDDYEPRDDNHAYQKRKAKDIFEEYVSNARSELTFFPNAKDVVSWENTIDSEDYNSYTEVPGSFWIMELQSGKIFMIHKPTCSSSKFEKQDDYATYKRLTGGGGGGGGSFTGELSGTYKYTCNTTNDSSATFSGNKVTISYTSSGNTQSQTYTWERNGSSLTVTKQVGTYETSYTYTLSGDGDGTVTLTEGSYGEMQLVFGSNAESPLSIEKQ